MVRALTEPGQTQKPQRVEGRSFFFSLYLLSAASAPVPSHQPIYSQASQASQATVHLVALTSLLPLVGPGAHFCSLGPQGMGCLVTDSHFELGHRSQRSLLVEDQLSTLCSVPCGQVGTGPWGPWSAHE